MADSPPKSDPKSVQPEHQRPDRDRQNAAMLSGLAKIEEQLDQFDQDMKLVFEQMDAISEKLYPSEKVVMQAAKEALEASCDALKASKNAKLPEFRARLCEKSNIASKLKDNKP